METKVIFPTKMAYVMTHYPRVALTFISGEIKSIEGMGGTIAPIVMNPPSSADLTTAEALEAKKASLYLKKHPGRLLAAMARVFMAHPWKMLSLVGTAVGSARLDPKLIMRRLVHLGYGALTWEHCRKNKIGHLHAHFGQAPATIAWFAAAIGNFDRGRNCTWSFTIHGFQDFVNENDARLDLKAGSAQFVACVSDFTKSQLCRITDVRSWDRFHVIRCGIDLNAFLLRPPRPIRPVPRIVVVGRLSPEKGHLVLLRATRLLKDRGIDVEVEIVGSGPFEAQIRQEEERLGLATRVRYVGELLPADVSRRLVDADIFCLPSFAEGIPVSIMEAMAVGVPVVTTLVGGIPELAVDDVTALVVPASNEIALANALARMIEDVRLRDRVVTAARAAVEEAHCLERNVAALACRFRELRAVHA